ncbi:MAG TPA: hypothetical protein VIR55_07105 [Ignavibacteria bacterium]
MKKLLNIIFICSFFITISFSQQTKTAKNFDQIKARIDLGVQNSLVSKMTSQEKAQLKKGEEDISWMNKLSKTSGYNDRKYFFMNGNLVSGNIYNYGGIAPGAGLLRHVNNMVWHGIGDIYQFMPMVLASVVGKDGKRYHISSDALNDTYGRDVSPDGTLIWGWEPLPEYADPDQPFMASSGAADTDGDGKPDSWPRSWYNPTLGKYVWPGYLSQDATSADLEVFWGMDDRDNREFPYYPFWPDTLRMGLGVKVEGRALQWSNPLAEDCIFFVYTIMNVSPLDLDTVRFGMYGDIDVGGGYAADPTEEAQDDYGYFISPFDSTVPLYARNMIYCWDGNGRGHLGLKTHYTGCKFLESPGNQYDGIDNDGDGIIDESQTDGIDNDHDWNPATDDVGIDGIANTLDEGEGDGVPTAGKILPSGDRDPLHPGEPNFELTDLDESDQIGLTSFNTWTWSTDGIRNDENMWRRTTPGNFEEITQDADITFVYGSGNFSLKSGDVKRFSIALLFGEDLNDILLNAETVQKIYNANYRFYKPPAKPNITIVPGDKKVTIYWDNVAEESVDPLLGKDFEGYVIYRSTDPLFGDIATITDGKGNSFLSEPLKDPNGKEAKWDLINNWKGYHPLDYPGRGVKYYLGDNTGLVHSYVDSNQVINGQVYYYAVVAYDHGDEIGVPPTETTKRIITDPVTGKITYDPNTGRAIPGPRAAGYTAPDPTSGKGVNHIAGISTASINFKILGDLAVENNKEFIITVSDTLESGNTKTLTKNYSLLCNTPITQTVLIVDTNYSKLKIGNLINDNSFSVKDASGKTFTKGTDYIIDFKKGLIRRTLNSSIPSNSVLYVTSKYYPIYQSTYFNNEDYNPVFDGILLTVKDDELAIDYNKSKWVQGNSNYTAKLALASVGQKIKYPADYEIRFSKNKIDSAYCSIGGRIQKWPVNYSVKNITENIPITTYLVENPSTRDSMWSPGEEIVFIKPGGTVAQTTWGLTLSKPTDSTVTPIAPTDGDVFLFATKRPLTNADKYSFVTKSAQFNSEIAKSKLDNIRVVPNPYVAYNEIEPSDLLPGQLRGERRIYFDNLPPKATIRIFTLAGELVKKIEHNSNLENGREYWNLLNDDNLGVAFGMYIAHIDCYELGSKVLKFGLIK